MQPQQAEAPPVRLAYDYTGAQAATGLSRSTLKRAVADGELACCKVGTRVLFTERQLKDWLESKTFKLKETK
jgi:excisionase family DNA binding protein